METIRDLKHTKIQPSTKKARVSSDIIILTGGDNDDMSIGCALQYIHRLRVYVFMLAVTGNREVESNVDQLADKSAAR
eukprot:16433603-Heterocapsa_arctica.AAC.1